MSTINDYEKFIDNLSGSRDRLFDVIPKISSKGDLYKLSAIESVINGIINQLSIKKGSYLFNPEFGESIFKYLFELSNDINLEEITRLVSAVIEYNRGSYQSNFKVSLDSTGKKVYINITIYKKNTNEKVTRNLIFSEGSIYESG
jgi:hypothetical protein